MLPKNIIIKVERLLVPLGTWPSSWNWWVTTFNIISLFAYWILVLVKNILNPEGESIESAFSLAHGGLYIAIYCMTMFLRKEKLAEIIEFIKTPSNFAATREKKEIFVNAGREFEKIFRAYSYFLPSTVIVRILMPSVEYGYNKFYHKNETFYIPPAQGFPVEIFGEMQVYVIETIVSRAFVLTLVMGVSCIYIITALTICANFNVLKMQLENLQDEDSEFLEDFIRKHNQLIRITKTFNEIFSPYFFTDCFLSCINLAILMFSILSYNASIQNSLSEMPIVACGLSQLFLGLHFGDRIMDASKGISMAAYKSEWYGKSVKHQKKILFIIMRAQRPQVVSIGNRFMIASVLLFSQICQRAWGAFNILRTSIDR